MLKDLTIILILLVIIGVPATWFLYSKLEKYFAKKRKDKPRDNHY